MANVTNAKPRPGEFKVLTFDCYGTLVDWEAGIVAALKKGRAWVTPDGVAATDEALLEAFARSEHKQEQIETGFRPYPEILRAVFADFVSELTEHVELAEHTKLGDSNHPTLAEDAAAFAHSVGDWPLFPDTVAALRPLKENYRLIIVSNVDRTSFARTQEKLGVEFDAIVTADDVRSYKPEPNHFTRALELVDKWGIQPSEVLHVAQSLYHDHAPALELGLKTVWINRRTGRAGGGATPTTEATVRPTWELPDMCSLADML